MNSLLMNLVSFNYPECITSRDPIYKYQGFDTVYVGCKFMIADETNEASIAVDGPQKISADQGAILPSLALKMPAGRPDAIYTTADGQSIPQFADILVTHATWSGMVPSGI